MNSAAYIQLVLVLCIPTMWLADRWQMDRKANLLAAGLIAIGLPLIPIKGMMITGYWFGVLGHLSVTSTILLAYGVLRRCYPEASIIDDASRRLLLLSIGTTAVVFYPLALGLSPFDPYRLGFQPTGLTVIVMALSLLAWVRHYRAAAVLLLLPVLGFNLGLLESGNLWDYLFDPFLVFYSWFAAGKVFLRFIRKRVAVAQTGSDST